MIIILAAIAMATDTPAAPAAPADDPVVCKRDRDSEVGTHMRPKPTCMKKSDWDLVAKNTQDELRTAKDRMSFDPDRAEGHRPQ